MRRPVKDRRPFPSFKIVGAHCRCQCRGYYPPGASPIWLAAARPIEADYSPIMGIRGYGRLTGRCPPGSRFFEFPPKRVAFSCAASPPSLHAIISRFFPRSANLADARLILEISLARLARDDNALLLAFEAWDWDRDYDGWGRGRGEEGSAKPET